MWNLQKVQEYLFYRTSPPVAASVFCKDFAILAMRIFIFMQENSMWVQLVYFLTAISFWFMECLFLIDGTLTLTKIYGIG